ncbi:MAG TPA: hypothetical protein VGF75_07615 [Candidatus Saccharimonadales bacterium]
MAKPCKPLTYAVNIGAVEAKSFLPLLINIAERLINNPKPN